MISILNNNFWGDLEVIFIILKFPSHVLVKANEKVHWADSSHVLKTFWDKVYEHKEQSMIRYK